MKVREVVEVLAGFPAETVKGIIAAAESLRKTNEAMEALEPPKKRRGRKKGSKNVEKEPEPAPKKVAPKKASSKKTKEEPESY